MDQNQHVKDYLKYYIGFEKSPGFAVLLNGAWGIGKTFLVREFIKPFSDGGLKCAYISLYGIGSAEELDDAVLRALYPLLYNKSARMGGRALKAIGKVFRFEIEGKPEDFLSKANADVFIFDDLERCEMPINKVLGYINEFVEHEGRKVIVIANEKEINENNEYVRIREKLIGKRLQIQSVFEQALSKFSQDIRSGHTRAFLELKSNLISEIYHQSALQNLRILQQTMWDFERVYSILGEKHTSHDAAMSSLLGLLFALSFELKAGRLKEENLCGRQSSLVAAMMRAHRENTGPSPLTTAQTRYPGVRLESTILSDETLINLLVRGILDQEIITSELNSSSFFVTVAEEPEWRTVWYAFERTDDEFNSALVKMEQAFLNRQYLNPGEMLHVFGIRLWLSRINVLAKARDDVVAECKTYIDHLYEEKRLPLPAKRGADFDFRSSGYGGLGIHESDTPDYRILFNYLRDKQGQADLDRRPGAALELIASMKHEPAQFFQKINITADTASEWHDVPVFAELNPATFVADYLSLPPAGQRAVTIAFSGRYQHGMLQRDLASERDWAAEVRRLLLEEASKMPPISKYRIEQNVGYAFDPHFKNESVDMPPDSEKEQEKSDSV